MADITMIAREAHHDFDMLSLLTQIGAIPGETAESAGA